MLIDIRADSKEPDPEARAAIWRAICYAANMLAGQCKVYISRERGEHISDNPPVPDAKVDTWKLVEALSLVTILLKADRVKCSEVPNLFGQNGPLAFLEDGQDRYLWTQPKLEGDISKFIGIPDLLVTSSPGKPTAKTTLRIIECKCRKRLGAHDIRAEFGKGHDLRVTSYLIWSYYKPSPRAIAGARGFGLDLVEVGFESSQRPNLVSKPEKLIEHVAKTIEASKRERRFALALIESGREIGIKLRSN